MKKLGINKHSGFTLLEVMVALLVLSIGLLGLAMLQATNLQFNSDAYTRTQATYLAYDIIDRMRANLTAVTNGLYDVNNNTDYTTKYNSYLSCYTGSGSCFCDTKSCDSSNLATYDLGKWYYMQEKYLPGTSPTATTHATITRAAGNLVTITIHWTEKDIARTQKWEVQL